MYITRCQVFALMNVAIFFRACIPSPEDELQVELLKRIAERKQYHVIDTIIARPDERETYELRLEYLLDLAERGEVSKVLVPQVAHLGKTPGEAMHTLDILQEFRVSVYIHDLGMETFDAYGNPNAAFISIRLILDGFAESEQVFRSTRIRNGQARAKANGKHIGRPSGSGQTRRQVLEKYPNIVRKLKRGLPMRKIAHDCAVSLNTVRKVKKALSPPVPLKQLQLGLGLN